MRIKETRINEMITPVGIDIERPDFAWQFESCRTGMMQQSVQITVGTNTFGCILASGWWKGALCRNTA